MDRIFAIDWLRWICWEESIYCAKLDWAHALLLAHLDDEAIINECSCCKSNRSADANSACKSWHCMHCVSEGLFWESYLVIGFLTFSNVKYLLFLDNRMECRRIRCAFLCATYRLPTGRGATMTIRRWIWNDWIVIDCRSQYHMDFERHSR
jgi:hypothetical protein